MKPISKGQFLFYQQIGHPYSGPVEGMGWVGRKPFIAASDNPDNGAYSDGIFLLPKEEDFILPADNTSVRNDFHFIKEYDPEKDTLKKDLKKAIKAYFTRLEYTRLMNSNLKKKPSSIDEVSLEGNVYNKNINRYKNLIYAIDNDILFIDNVPDDIYLEFSLRRHFDKYFKAYGNSIIAKRREEREPQNYNTDVIAVGALGIGLSIAKHFWEEEDGILKYYCPIQRRLYKRYVPGEQPHGYNKKATSKGIKQNTAARIAKIGRFGGVGLGLYNLYDNRNKYFQLNYSPTIMDYIEVSVNTVSILGGVYGGFFGIGWELGRGITEREWYKKGKEDILFDLWRRSSIKW